MATADLPTAPKMPIARAAQNASNTLTQRIIAFAPASTKLNATLTVPSIMNPTVHRALASLKAKAKTKLASLPQAPKFGDRADGSLFKTLAPQLMCGMRC